MSHSGH